MRNSSIELFRILAMLLIVANHSATHGLLVGSDVHGAPLGNLLFAQLCGCGGKLGVDMFVLVTGYFLSASCVRPSSIVLLWLKTFFWGCFGLSVALCLDVHFSRGMVVTTLCPFVRSNYWFVSCYVALALLSPFLAMGLRTLAKRQHFILICILLALFSFPMQYASSFGGSPLTWFFVMFVIGAYLRNHVDVSRVKPRSLAFSSGVCGGAVVLWLVACDTVCGGRYFSCWGYIRDMNSIVMVVLSVSLFLLFARNAFSSVWVNRLASCMFGVYLIHDHQILRDVIWQQSFHLDNMIFQSFHSLVLVTTGSICLVFVGSVILERIRVIFAAPFEKRIRGALSAFDLRMSRYFQAR